LELKYYDIPMTQVKSKTSMVMGIAPLFIFPFSFLG
jgi:hypothetical protein